jgi:ubiquitin-conjugating enzyme E2 Z
MSSNPYENEPGFEDSLDTASKKAYVDKICHETIRIAVIERMEEYLGLMKLQIPRPPIKDITLGDGIPEFELFEPFKDRLKLRFLWYYDSYLQTIDREALNHKEGSKFPNTDFESPGNCMDGTYQYTDLRRRLILVKKALDKEAENWAAEGQQIIEKEHPFGSQLRQIYEQVVEIYKTKDGIALHLELVDNNPFVWELVLLGQPMTNLDGGMIKVRINISPRFPHEQPRVRVETPLFHHRIANHGQLCYLLRGSSDDLKKHVESIIEAIQDESPTYDPRTLVNIEASRLFWGSADDKKLYNRKLRRSIQDSTE